MCQTYHRQPTQINSLPIFSPMRTKSTSSTDGFSDVKTCLEDIGRSERLTTTFDRSCAYCPSMSCVHQLVYDEELTNSLRSANVVVSPTILSSVHKSCLENLSAQQSTSSRQNFRTAPLTSAKRASWIAGMRKSLRHRGNVCSLILLTHCTDSDHRLRFCAFASGGTKPLVCCEQQYPAPTTLASYLRISGLLENFNLGYLRS